MLRIRREGPSVSVIGGKQVLFPADVLDKLLGTWHRDYVGREHTLLALPPDTEVAGAVGKILHEIVTGGDWAAASMDGDQYVWMKNLSSLALLARAEMAGERVVHSAVWCGEAEMLPFGTYAIRPIAEPSQPKVRPWQCRPGWVMCPNCLELQPTTDHCRNCQKAFAEARELPSEETCDAKAAEKDLAEAKILLRRWLDRAQECEGAVMLAHAHGAYLPPTTIGDDTRRMLDRLHPAEPKGDDIRD